MKDIIYKYINNDSRSNEYTVEEIQKAVDIIRKFIDILNNCKIEENGEQRRLSQVEEFSLIYDFVSNRKYVENEHSHSVVGTLNNGDSVCEGFSKLTEVLCDLRGIPFLYKHVATKYGEHGNFQVIVSDERGIKHCLHCDPTIDCLNKKDILTYNAFLISTNTINNYYSTQKPSAGVDDTCLFWDIAVDGKSVDEIKEEIEKNDDNELEVMLAMIRGESKQDVVNSKYDKIKNGIVKLSEFLGVYTPNIESNEKVLEAYQALADRYKELNVPLDRNELFETIKRLYRQNIHSKNINTILEQRISETNKNEKKYWDKDKNIMRENVQKVVYQYAELANIDDKEMLENLIERLTELNVDDAIDTILVSLNSLLNRKVLTPEQILSNSDLILNLNPEKYHSSDELIARINWLKSMNMEYPQMPLTENHKLVVEIFDKLNGIIGTDFDSFYTGGLVGYLATGHQLKRYHTDLDLLINEEQLLALYNLIQQSDDFEFETNMNHKEENGHEFKLVYKNTPISVGLFLFNRLPNQEMVLKEYYYPNQERSNGLHVNERHITGDYASMIFSNQTMKHNGSAYKTQSLEGIYHTKRDSRPKDRYDTHIIESFVDMDIVHKLDTNKDGNYNINGIPVVESIVEKLDEIITQSKQRNDINIESHNVSHRK